MMAKRKKKAEVTGAAKSKKTRPSVVELEQNKILRVILIIAAFLVIGFFLFVFVSRSLTGFEYGGVKFNIVKFCDAGPPCLVTYKTTLPVKVSDNRTYLSLNKTHDYNFYLRNDPRKLDVNFDGNIIFRKLMALHPRDDFVCEGKGAIAAANLVQLYDVLGTEVITDKNSTCDPYGQYIWLDIKPANRTSINEIYPGCYQINIKNCEILEGTEKFMIETFVEVNKELRNVTN